MTTIAINEAVAALPALIAAHECGEFHEVAILRDGRPIARLAPIETQRDGVARGIFEVGDGTPSEDAEVVGPFQSDDKPGPR
ncbi:antitoxin (DNA-binding transcriptional repressor) of toxin-antitoxin stability system [Paraburkholderia sp. WC7.3g]|uniref:Prevent-host-death protein n=1 Tax=Paraburkholderia podalyriae TaxID=1938811 RepID=A0ABR7Q205_9BURK|nr:prevent-host-death protein [Paraburkholderia podalyriae]MBC8752579.1 prevent-host-death protein [Paraburkholderia podalyriae]